MDPASRPPGGRRRVREGNGRALREAGLRLRDRPAALGCCRFARVRHTAHSVWQPVRAPRCSATRAEAGPGTAL